jgi:hypothetical protein
MWADSGGFFFFLARLSVAPAARSLFLVGGEARCLAVVLLLGVALLDSLRLFSVIACISPDGCSVGFVASIVVIALGTRPSQQNSELGPPVLPHLESFTGGDGPSRGHHPW